jgi:hypothetical protein
MNLAQLERVKSELKQRFYKRNKIEINLINIKNVFSIKPTEFTLSNGQSVFWLYAYGLRVQL